MLSFVTQHTISIQFYSLYFFISFSTFYTLKIKLYNLITFNQIYFIIWNKQVVTLKCKCGKYNGILVCNQLLELQNWSLDEDQYQEATEPPTKSHAFLQKENEDFSCSKILILKSMSCIVITEKTNELAHAYAYRRFFYKMYCMRFTCKLWVFPVHDIPNSISSHR